MRLLQKRRFFIVSRHHSEWVSNHPLNIEDLVSVRHDFVFLGASVHCRAKDARERRDRIVLFSYPGALSPASNAVEHE